MNEPIPHVKLATSLGDIYLELHPDRAPTTVASFLSRVDEDYYRGLIFHRVIDNFMIQGGGYTPDYRLKTPKCDRLENEAANGLSNERGTIAMARTSDPHSAQVQFFINLRDNDFLDHSSKTSDGWGYCVFGRVVAGHATVDAIAKAPVKSDPRADQQRPARPKTAILIRSVERVELDQIPADDE